MLHRRQFLARTLQGSSLVALGSAVPAFVWGLVFANVVQGVPLDEGHNYTGTLADLLNPYALLGGLTTLLLFFTHGVVFVTLKTEGAIRDRARRLATRAGLVTIVVAASFLVLTSLMHGTLASVVPGALLPWEEMTDRTGPGHGGSGGMGDVP